MTHRVQLELKAYGSSDLDPAEWESTKPEDVFFVLDLEIGEKGDERADLFYVTVATPEGAEKYGKADASRGRNLLILPVFSPRALEERIASILEECAAPTWEDSVKELKEHFQHEYDDYVVDN